jgi:hypothetical protein
MAYLYQVHGARACAVVPSVVLNVVASAIKQVRPLDQGTDMLLV